MKRSTGAALFAIVLLAIIVRLLPLFRTLYWGSDFGEYYALTRTLVEEGALPETYRGWGVTYPDFPGLFVINGAFVFIGATPGTSAALVLPILASFGVLPVFLIAARVTGDDLAGLVAAAFLAVTMFHVYPTSHAIPAGLGDLLLLGALVLFLGIRRSPKFLPMFLMVGFALVVTHHLATYMLLVTTGSAIALRAGLSRTLTVRDIRYEVIGVAAIAATTLAFWAWSATSLWNLIVGNSPMPGPALIAGASLAIVAGPAIIVIRRRTRWRFRPRPRTVRGAAMGAAAAFATSILFVVIAGTGAIPGTSLRIPLEDTVPYLPMLAFISLSAAGRKTMDFSREGVDVTAWFLGLVASLIAGVVVAPVVLIPNRHLEYLAIPFAIMAGAGLRWLLIGVEGRGRVGAIGASCLLIAGTFVGAYPPPEALGHQEGIALPTVAVALWVGTYADGLVAGDHLLSTALFGFGGVDATWDRETSFWHTTDANAALAAMADVPVLGSRSRVSWVVIDDDLRAGVQVSPFAPALPLLPAEEAKFLDSPFHRVYDSGFAQVYYVNWDAVP